MSQPTLGTEGDKQTNVIPYARLHAAFDGVGRVWETDGNPLFA